MKNYGLGLVGATLQGGFLLSPSVVDSVDSTGIRLRAIHESNYEIAHEVERNIEYGYSTHDIQQSLYLTRDLWHLFNDFMLDALLVSAPASDHRELVEYALSGKEKIALTAPLANTMEDAQAIVQAAQEKPLLVNLPRRFDTGWKKAYELLNAGVIGKLQTINLRVFLPETNYLRLWERTQSGTDDLFMAQLSGYMDVFNWFAGTPCLHVAGIGDEGDHDLDDYDPKGPYQRIFRQLPLSWRIKVSSHTPFVDRDDFPTDHYLDHAAIQMLFGNNVMGTLNISSSGPTARDAEDLELVGEKGRLFYNAAEGSIRIQFWNGSAEEHIDFSECKEKSLLQRYNEAFIAQLPDYIEGAAPAVSAQEAADALEMALSALESIHNNGMPVMFECDIQAEPLPTLEVEPEVVEPQVFEPEVFEPEVFEPEIVEEVVEEIGLDDICDPAWELEKDYFAAEAQAEEWVEAEEIEEETPQETELIAEEPEVPTDEDVFAFIQPEKHATTEIPVEPDYEIIDEFVSDIEIVESEAIETEFYPEPEVPVNEDVFAFAEEPVVETIVSSPLEPRVEDFVAEIAALEAKPVPVEEPVVETIVSSPLEPRVEDFVAEIAALEAKPAPVEEPVVETIVSSPLEPRVEDFVAEIAALEAKPVPVEEPVSETIVSSPLEPRVEDFVAEIAALEAKPAPVEEPVVETVVSTPLEPRVEAFVAEIAELEAKPASADEPAVIATAFVDAIEDEFMEQDALEDLAVLDQEPTAELFIEEPADEPIQEPTYEPLAAEAIVEEPIEDVLVYEEEPAAEEWVEEPETVAVEPTAEAVVDEPMVDEPVLFEPVVQEPDIFAAMFHQAEPVTETTEEEPVEVIEDPLEEIISEPAPETTQPMAIVVEEPAQDTMIDWPEWVSEGAVEEELLVEEPEQQVLVEEPSVEEPEQQVLVEEPSVEEPEQQVLVEEPSVSEPSVSEPSVSEPSVMEQPETVVEEPVQETFVEEKTQAVQVDEPAQITQVGEPAQITQVGEPAQVTPVGEPAPRMTVDWPEWLTNEGPVFNYSAAQPEDLHTRTTQKVDVDELLSEIENAELNQEPVVEAVAAVNEPLTEEALVMEELETVFTAEVVAEDEAEALPEILDIQDFIITDDDTAETLETDVVDDFDNEGERFTSGEQRSPQENDEDSVVESPSVVISEKIHLDDVIWDIIPLDPFRLDADPRTGDEYLKAQQPAVETLEKVVGESVYEPMKDAPLDSVSNFRHTTTASPAFYEAETQRIDLKDLPDAEWSPDEPFVD